MKDLGCRIAIDDFGAGYTSFRNLRKLGVDMVKIDGAFVENINRSEDDRAFVLTLIDLASGSISRLSPNGCRTRKRRRSSRSAAATICRGS